MGSVGGGILDAPFSTRWWISQRAVEDAGPYMDLQKFELLS